MGTVPQGNFILKEGTMGKANSNIMAKGKAPKPKISTKGTTVRAGKNKPGMKGGTGNR